MAEFLSEEIDITDEVAETYKADINESDFSGCDDALSIYLKEIGRFPLLRLEEEQELTRKYYYDKDSDARLKLINHNLRLVVNIAKSFHSQDIPLLDLIQEGNCGLMKGIERFEPEKGYRLSTYCTWWIRQACQRYIQNNNSIIRIPVHLNDKVYKYRKFVTWYNKEFGNNPTREQVLEALKFTSAELESILTVDCDVVSLDSPVGEDGDSVLGDFVVAESSTEVDGEMFLLRQAIQEALNCCNEREKEVIKYRFGFIDGRIHTLEEVGVMYGVTRERIRQIETKALRKLRHPSRVRLLEDFKEG